jgi:hypothetical protein
VRQHRAFAQRARDDEAIDAGVDLQLETALHLGMIELVRLGEFGRDCW